MSLVFHGHPLSSFCWKVLIALYENETPFEFHLLKNLFDPEERAAHAALWPLAKIPVLEDRARREVVAETTIIIDYLDLHYPGNTHFVPDDPEAARQTRFWDRVYDLYLEVPMQKVVGDRLRPAAQRDPYGVEEARTLLATTLTLIEAENEGAWAAGEEFSLADCAAAPALFYADKVMPIAGRWPNALALLERLKARPSFARVLEEAEPYFQYFPSE